jgi:hypothetical protein
MHASFATDLETLALGWRFHGHATLLLEQQVQDPVLALK